MGGFSPGVLRFVPVVATSAGMVGRSGVLGALDDGAGVLSGVPLGVLGGGVLGDLGELPVHAEAQSRANAVIVTFARTDT